MLWSQSPIQTLGGKIHILRWCARAYKRGNEYLFLGQRALEKIRGIGDLGRVLAECGISFVRTGGEQVGGGGEIVIRLAFRRRRCSGAGVTSMWSCTTARSRSRQPPATPDPEGDLAPEEFHTPGVKTITQIAAFTGLPATSQIKSIVMAAGGATGEAPRAEIVLVLLRGDHQLSENKFAAIARTSQIRPATAEQIRASFGADGGSLGPVGIENAGVRILADEALRGRRNMISGANRNDYHLRNVTPGEDFGAGFFDLRQAAEGDRCVSDGGPLTFTTARVIREAEDALAVAVEKNCDADGIVLPPSIAPFTVVVTPVHPDRVEAARKIYSDLLAAGVDTLLDDRDARPGVKFKDADLIGIPYRINVGKKLAEGLVEFVTRSPKSSVDVPVGEIRIPG